MSTQEVEKRLLTIAEPVLRAHGFQRTRRLEFIRRPTAGRKERIGLSVFVDRAGKARATLGVGIRFEEVERFRLRELDAGMPTIGLPMHFLSPDRKYFDWPLQSDDDWERLERDLEPVVRSAVDFLSRFSTLNEVQSSLESDDPQNWFTLGPKVRIETLALLDCAKGDLTGAITRLEHAVAALDDAPDKERVPLIRLRDHILSLSSSSD